ncbi:hypothetical protein LTR36_003703 [Oleoguttula mirabilis]|uniref:M-phase inducer phosphatase n=1 Tax=Oleoguttula mirabilis TaxID=1507867 RepID=A0AAV9JJJ7_9PEZI|nr:hypothetical protein LTR36_003703 [Oleoguttula mirabilis]
MEYSSPLAAMRPQPCPAWGNRRDLPVSRSVYHGYQTYGASSFDFKELSMHQKPAKRLDYFTLRPARGSSPTSSLTADLDANFHIDKSPQAPTPRRSLFTTDLFRPRGDAGHRLTPPTVAEGATTPPIPSSSPGIDMMDISPLPHKAPYFMAQVTLPSPTPEETPEEEDFRISPDLLSAQGAITPPPAPPVQPPTFLFLPERRRPVTRPSLSRTKGHATNYIPLRLNSAENPLPLFRFGNGVANGLSCASTPSLLESFTESPVDAPSPSVSAPMLPPPRRPSLSSVNRTTGSPSTGHVRKPSVGRPAFVRPQRKIMRRSLSMFQHPDDLMREEQDTFEAPSGLSSVMDLDQEHQPKLPYFTSTDEPDGLPRISKETMIDVLEHKYSAHYHHIRVIDCRFEYEYNGGHIQNAVNFNDKQQLTNELFDNADSSTTLLILHCEYSVHRAPLTAKFIRGHDRNVNAASYPRLSYPEMYILDGGYSKFFESHQHKCFPQNYVEMSDHRHEQACELGMAKVKGQAKARQKLHRAQTFAFGQNGHDDMEDSPTAQGRGGGIGPRSQSTFSVGLDISEGIGQSFARRMASY